MPPFVTATSTFLSLVYPGQGLERTVQQEHVERMNGHDFMKVMQVWPATPGLANHAGLISLPRCLIFSPHLRSALKETVHRSSARTLALGEIGESLSRVGGFWDCRQNRMCMP